MTLEPRQLYRSRSISNQFMVQTSGYDQLEGEAPEASKTDYGIVIDLLKIKRPALLTEDRFHSTMLEKIAHAKHFGVLALQPDFVWQPSNAMDQKAMVAAMEVLAAVIDDICGMYEGAWGVSSTARFGCVLPRQCVRDCQAISEKIRALFFQRCNLAVSCGIAAYPMINYSKSDIFENACKALMHARYYEDGRSVIFDAVSLNISGDLFYQGGQIASACSEYRQALRLDPGCTNVHNSLGVCYGINGDLARALVEFETTAWLDANEIMAVYNAGLIYMLMDQSDKALACFLKTIEINDEIFEAWLKTGMLYIERNDFRNASIYLEKATRLNPKPAYTYRYLGECYEQLGDIKAAISAYKKAVKQNPNDAASFSALGYLFEKSGENKEIALMFCKQSVAIEPNSGLFRFRLGCLLHEMALLDDALNEFETAERLGYNTGDYIKRITDFPVVKAS